MLGRYNYAFPYYANLFNLHLLYETNDLSIPEKQQNYISFIPNALEYLDFEIRFESYS